MRLPATTCQWKTVSSWSSRANAITALGTSPQAVEPSTDARAPRGVLGEVADTDDRVAELVGEVVEPADRVADEPFFVGVDAAEVIADRVDDDQPDVPDHRGEVAEPPDVLGKPDRASDEMTLVRAAPAAWSRGTVSTSIESSDET